MITDEDRKLCAIVWLGQLTPGLFSIVVPLLLLAVVHPIHARSRSEVPVQADDPVENMESRTVEGGLVIVTFDIVAEDPEATFDVLMLFSVDGGVTFSQTAEIHMTGDAGVVLAGTGKRIVWEATRVVEPGQLSQLEVRLIVRARLGPEARPSHWGIRASFSPTWTVADSLGDFGSRTTSHDIRGSDFRVGFVRGREWGREWGISLVRRAIKEGSERIVTEPEFFFFFECDPSIGPCDTTTTFTARKDASFWGVEAHYLAPIYRIGTRVQLGAFLAGGIGLPYGGTLSQRTRGPIFEDPLAEFPDMPRQVPEGPGFIANAESFGSTEDFLEVLPGQVEALSETEAFDIFGNTDPIALVRVLLVADVSLGERAKLRFGGGFNYPGYELFSVDFVYLFGAQGR